MMSAIRALTDADRDEALALAERVWAEHRPAPGAVPVPAAPAWHIVHCVGRSDQHAIDFLDDRRVETYYPLVRELRPVPRKALSKKQRASGIVLQKPRLVPFFPRYLFVRFDMGKEGWREIFDFAGIGGMVCEGDLPVRVSDALIKGLKAREIDGAVPGKTPAHLIFTLGEAVRIKAGPFATFDGVVDKLPQVAIEEIDADTRIRVAVAVFGQATPVDLELSQIEKL